MEEDDLRFLTEMEMVNEDASIEEKRKALEKWKKEDEEYEKQERKFLEKYVDDACVFTGYDDL